MEDAGLIDSFLQPISEGQHVAQLVVEFNEAHTENNSSRGEIAKAFLTFLNWSTEHNHNELTRILLADKRCNMDAVDEQNPRPLFVAMRPGNLELVEIFLRAGSSLDLESPLSAVLGNNETVHDQISTFEYACFLDKPDLLKLLVTCYEDPIKKR